MAQYLWTGASTLDGPGPREQFGMVGASTPPAEEGTVLLSLRREALDIRIEDGTVEIRMPERHAVELAKKLALVTTEVTHLRSLHRLGLLSPAALHEDTEPDDDAGNGNG